MAANTGARAAIPQKRSGTFSSPPAKRRMPPQKLSSSRSALPGLDEVEGASLDDGEAVDGFGISTKDALAYLKLVRSEASAIPELLTAPSKDPNEDGPDPIIYNNGTGDTRGFYSDGVYIAAPILGPAFPMTTIVTEGDDASGEGSWRLDMTPQQAYTKRLLSIFRKQREALHAADQIQATSKLPLGTQVSCFDSSHQNLKFFTTLLKSPPSPTYLAALSQETVLSLLKTAIRKLNRRHNVTRFYDEWVWGLLCRLGDVGTLNNDEVSVVRELGKKAVWVGIGFMDPEAAEITEEYEGDEEEDFGEDKEAGDQSPSRESSSRLKVQSEIYSLKQTDNKSSAKPCVIGEVMGREKSEDATSLEAAKRKLLSTLNGGESKGTRLLGRSESGELSEEEVPNTNTRVTIDMIIAVAGEMYGQRDLLEFRDCWGGESGLWGPC